MKKLSYEFVKNVFNEKGYELLSDEYINNSQKLKVMCPKKHEFYISYNNFKRGRGCSYCYKYRKLSSKEVSKYLEEFGYKLLSEYETANKKIKVKCPNGHIYDVTYAHFSTGERCIYCQGKKLHHDDVKKIIENEGYQLLSEYTLGTNKIKIKCDKGHIYKATYTNFQQGRRCPRCSSSKGEKVISTVLDKYNIKYMQEYIFKGCKYIQPLRCDFYIPSINMVIEYDGEHHFRPVHYSNKYNEYKMYEDTKNRDSVKNAYCKDNGIKLIRIPYTEFENIENILVKELNLKVE